MSRFSYIPIPKLVLFCINEIDQRGATVNELYSNNHETYVEFNEKIIQDFIRTKYLPDFSEISDVKKICDLLKQFLKYLSETLINSESFNKLEVIDSINDATLFKNKLLELPVVNKVTLALLILHFKKIAYDKDYLITRNDISKIFAPIIIGFNNEGEINDFTNIQISVSKNIIFLMDCLFLWIK